jgi:hypothetical protein
MYTLGTAAMGFPGQAQWETCNKCSCLAYGGYPTPGTCIAGGVHDFTFSKSYKLAYLTDNDNRPNVTFTGHEMGHCLGLDHSWSANPDTEYGDPFDIMSAMSGVKLFANKHNYGDLTRGEPAGPGLNAPTLHKLGWIPQNQVATYRASSDLPVTVNITALNLPENGGNLIARVLSLNHIYTVEFRQATRWDAGIGGDNVLIHELRSCYTNGQKNWRWCLKCNAFVWNGQAICPAGSIHNHGGS